MRKRRVRAKRVESKLALQNPFFFRDGKPEPEPRGSLAAATGHINSVVGRKLDYTRTSQQRREKQCTRSRGGGRAAPARLLVTELLDAPVLLRDLRLELIYASLRTLKHALHLGLVRE